MNTETQELIKKQCKGKPHIKLTVGYISNGQTEIKVYNETGEIENKDYVYEIGSITKTFVASLLAKYIYENKISPDDSIKSYINGLEDNRYYPPIKRLMTHTSGYSTNLPMSKMGLKPYKIYFTKGITNETFSLLLYMNEQDMIRIMNEIKLKDKDYRWQYSNFGISLVGYAIGVVSGKGYEETMDDYLLNDLNLQNSFSGTDPDKNILGYSKKDTTGGNWICDDNLLRPAGDISSTAGDLLRYAEINFNEELPYLSLCHRKYAKMGFPFAKLLNVDMGLGWWVGKNSDIIMHGGDTATFSSILIIDKSQKTAVVVLSNYPGNSLRLSKIAKSVLRD